MKLHFRKIGAGQPVVILHGLFGSSDNWQTFGKQLSSNGNAVYLVDLRNHGLSGHDNSLTYQVLADDIAELFRDEHLENAVIIGHSLGGKTAMAFAYRFPEKISGLIVVDIAPRQYPVQHRKILDALLSVDTEKLSGRQEAESILKDHIIEPAVVQFLMKNLYWREKTRLDWRFNLDAINNNIAEVGKRTAPETPFTKPVLFIKGAASDYISNDDEKEIYSLFENVEIRTAPNAGHWVHAENPSWLMETVISFLKKI